MGGSTEQGSGNTRFQGCQGESYNSRSHVHNHLHTWSHISTWTWQAHIRSFMKTCDGHMWRIFLTSWPDLYSPPSFSHNCSLQVYAVPFQWRLPIFIRKNLWHRVLEANDKQVPLISYSLKIRIHFVNQILKNKAYTNL